MENQICALCNQNYEGWGNNGRPLIEGEVCDECNKKVVKYRLELWKVSKKEVQQTQKTYRKTILHEYVVLLRAHGDGNDAYVGEFHSEIGELLTRRSEVEGVPTFTEIVEYCIDSSALNIELDKMHDHYLDFQDDKITFDEYCALVEELEEENE